jgi:hypothetical protein
MIPLDARAAFLAKTPANSRINIDAESFVARFLHKLFHKIEGLRPTEVVIVTPYETGCQLSEKILSRLANHLSQYRVDKVNFYTSSDMRYATIYAMKIIYDPVVSRSYEVNHPSLRFHPANLMTRSLVLRLGSMMWWIWSMKSRLRSRGTLRVQQLGPHMGPRDWDLNKTWNTIRELRKCTCCNTTASTYM